MGHPEAGGNVGCSSLVGPENAGRRDAVGATHEPYRFCIKKPAGACAVPMGVQVPGELGVLRCRGRAVSRDRLLLGLCGGLRISAVTRSAMSSSVLPECQRTPMRALAGSWSGSTVTSATRVRSRRLRSRSLVVGADQSVATFATAASSSALSGRGGLVVLAAARAGLGLSQLSEASLQTSLEAPGHEPVLRLDGQQRPFSPPSLVTSAFKGELGGTDLPHPAVGDLVSGGQGERDFVPAERAEQATSDRFVDGGGTHRAAGRGPRVVRAAPGAVIVGVAAHVVDVHVPAAATADNDALAEGAEPSRGGRAPCWCIGRQAGLGWTSTVPS